MIQNLCDYLNQEQLFNATFRPPHGIELRSDSWVCSEDIDLLKELAAQFDIRVTTWVAKAMSNGDLVFEFQVEDLERVPD